MIEDGRWRIAILDPLSSILKPICGVFRYSITSLRRGSRQCYFLRYQLISRWADTPGRRPLSQRPSRRRCAPDWRVSASLCPIPTEWRQCWCRGGCHKFASYNLRCNVAPAHDSPMAEQSCSLSPPFAPRCYSSRRSPPDQTPAPELRCSCRFQCPDISSGLLPLGRECRAANRVPMTAAPGHRLALGPDDKPNSTVLLPPIRRPHPLRGWCQYTYGRRGR